MKDSKRPVLLSVVSDVVLASSSTVVAFRRLILMIALLAGISNLTPANAESITITYFGTIESTGILPATQFDVGDSVEVSYTFESTTPDSRSADPTLGIYHNSLSDLQIRFGTYQASATSINNLQVGDDFGGVDYFLLESLSMVWSNDPLQNLTGPPLGGDWAAPISFVLQLVDPTATALSSDALPLVPLNPSQFDDGRSQITLAFDNPSQGIQSLVSARFNIGGAPTADAGPDQLVAVGSTVFLDGSASTDPDSDPLTFQWTLASAPAGSGSVLFDADTVSPNFVPDFEGLYEASLLVSDTTGPGTSDNVEITAIPPEQFAEMELDSASESVGDLIPDQVTTQGNQNALMNFLTQATVAIQEGDLAEAINKLQKALSRTDGCVLRGAPDGDGLGRDWITDCTEQTAVYDLLSSALAALTL